MKQMGLKSCQRMLHERGAAIQRATQGLGDKKEVEQEKETLVEVREGKCSLQMSSSLRKTIGDCDFLGIYSK